MAVPRHLDEAVARLRAASARIDDVRTKPANMDGLQEWLAALTDFCLALSDIQAFNNESLHERLHELAARGGLREFATPPHT